jgi:DNA-binding CsgD family transcriptional regulator
LVLGGIRPAVADGAGDALDRGLFVGRAAEVSTIHEAWSRARSGDRQAVFVAGDAGVGKSRLVVEVARLLVAEGAYLLRGGCVPELGAPYDPFIEPVTALADALTHGSIRLPEILTQDDRRLDRLRTLTGPEPDPMTVGRPVGTESLRMLFSACVDAFRAAAADTPTVLVLEDLHWAGDAALQMLRFLVTQTPSARLLVLLTMRAAPPDRSGDLMETVGLLYRLPGVRRLDLGGLSVGEIADYLVRGRGVPAPSAGATAAILRDRTGGNPFLMREVVRDAARRGGLHRIRETAVPAPEFLRANVEARLQSLGPARRRVLETAAVIGEEFDIPLLSAVSAARMSDGGSPDDPVAATYAALDAAAAVGLVETVPLRDALLRFPHGLARQAVLDLLSAYRLAADNLEVARVLEDRFPAADLRVQRLAHHYAMGAALGCADRAVHFLAEAARGAEEGLAHHDAAQLFERAAGLAGEAHHRDELRLRAARSYHRASRFRRALDLDEQVATTARGVLRLRAAVGYEASSWKWAEPGARAVELLSTALAEAPLSEDDPLHIRATAALGRAHAFGTDLERAAVLRSRAEELAERHGDDRLRAVVLQIGLQVAVAPADLADQHRRADALTELARRADDLRNLAQASFHRALICYVEGDPAGVASAQDELARTTRVVGEPLYEWLTGLVDFGRHLVAADFAAASRAAAASAELRRGFASGSEVSGPSSLQTFMLKRESGGLERARELLTGDEDPSETWLPGLLAMYVELGLREPAGRALHHLLSLGLLQHTASSSWPAVLSFAVDAAVWLGDLEGCDRLLPFAREYAGLNLMGGEFLAPLGSADRWIGSLESVLGLPTADDSLRAALEMDARMASPLHVATTLAALAAHRSRVARGRGSQGSTVLRPDRYAERARALADRYGLVRVVRLLDETPLPQDRASAERSAGSSALAGLTARESEVLQLVGLGYSNRRIAEHLVISEHTAANHVRSILGKTGAHNRTEAAYLARSSGDADERSVR